MNDRCSGSSSRHRVRVHAGSGSIALALALAASPALAHSGDATSSADGNDKSTANEAKSNAAAATPVVQGQQDKQGANAASDDLEIGSLDIPAAPDDVALPDVEPVITEREFNRIVPDLEAQDDAELDKPLESIEAFEARMAREQEQAATGTAGAAGAQAASTPAQSGQTGANVADDDVPLGDPALADGDASEEIEDAPVRDAELTAPLPSLDSFEVTPVEFAQEDTQGEKTPEVRYKVALEGIEEADKETEASLAGTFKELSALEDGDGKAANAAMVSARLTEDTTLIETILASEGWYSPNIRGRLVPSRDEDEPVLTARIRVTPGQRYTFSDITVEADPTIPETLIADNMPLKVGEPIVAGRVQGAEARIALALPENGYPFAKVGQRDILLDRDTGEGAYTLPVDVGPRGRFGPIVTTGDTAFDAKHVAVLARFKEGELYDSRKVDDLRKAMVGTGLFSTVAVEPEETGTDLGDGTQSVQLNVKQDAGPPRTIAGSLGYAAGEGITAQGSWTHRNMWPPEGALIAHAIAGTQQQGLGATFRRSNAGKRDRTLEITAEAFHNDYDAYSAYTGRLAARISRDSTPIWQKRYTYAFGVELLGTAETSYNFESGERERNTYYVAGVNGQVGFDTSDSLLDPTKGFRVTTLVQPEATLNNGFVPYVRARIDGSGYFPAPDSLVLAGRVRFGTIQGVDLVDIAPSRRLYAGGGGSVRGFSYQGLGEQAPDGKPIGGRSLNEASFEARYRFGNYGVVAFVDAGQAYRETMPQFNDLRYGVGIGGRFYTNFGPMRLDIATPIARRPGESRINLYLSIGQAF